MTTKKRETKVAKQLNAERVVASGATPWKKEDLEDEIFLYQHKEVLPTTKTYTMKMMDLDQLRKNAIDEGKEACFIIEHKGKRWFMIEEPVYEFLKDRFLNASN